jgi:hypothetical protein
MDQDKLKPNSIDAIQNSIKTGAINHRTPFLMLGLRLVLFIFFQTIFALIFLISGKDQPWEDSIGLWLFGVTLTNILTLVIISKLFQKEGVRYWQLVGFTRGKVLIDVLTTLGLFLLAGPIGYFPNIIFGNLLFGDAMIPAKMMFRELPMALAITGAILFPVTQGLIELPAYFIYIMPRIEAISNNKWLAIALSSLFLAIQHIAVPLIFDLRFISWRLVMFLPFAFFMGIIIHWRPRLIPYLMIGHVLIDLSTAIFIIPGMMP